MAFENIDDEIISRLKELEKANNKQVVLDHLAEMESAYNKGSNFALWQAFKAAKAHKIDLPTWVLNGFEKIADGILSLENKSEKNYPVTLAKILGLSGYELKKIKNNQAFNPENPKAYLSKTDAFFITLNLIKNKAKELGCEIYKEKTKTRLKGLGIDDLVKWQKTEELEYETHKKKIKTKLRGHVVDDLINLHEVGTKKALVLYNEVYDFLTER